MACLCLAMVANFDPSAVSTLGRVGEALVQRFSPAASTGRVELPRSPEGSYPYGSAPPLQSQQSPTVATSDRR